jgi:putative DNA primase/helicase
VINEILGGESPQLRDFRAELQADSALAAQVLAGSGTAQRSLRAVKAGDFLCIEIKPREMLLEPILPVQGLAMLHAKRGVGKTHIALGIAVAVASGKDFLRWKTPGPHKVLFVDGELPASVLQQWVAETVAAVGADEVGDNLAIITPDLQEYGIPDLATVGGQLALEEHIQSADLVILDNLSALVRAGNENEAESWLPLQAWALDLRRRGKSLLFVHHSGRSGNPRGTSKREDLLDTVIALRHSPSYRANEGLHAELHFEKTRHFHGKGAEPFEVEFQAGSDGFCKWVTRDLEVPGYEKAAVLFAEGYDPLGVKEELGVSRATAFRYQKQFRESQSHSPTLRA